MCLLDHAQNIESIHVYTWIILSTSVSPTSQLPCWQTLSWTRQTITVSTVLTINLTFILSFVLSMLQMYGQLFHIYA